MSAEPTTRPPELTRLPDACCGNTRRARPVTSSGYASPVRIRVAAAIRRDTTAGDLIAASSGESQDRYGEVDRLNAEERSHDASGSIDEQRAPQERGCAERPV